MVSCCFGVELGRMFLQVCLCLRPLQVVDGYLYHGVHWPRQAIVWVDPLRSLVSLVDREWSLAWAAEPVVPSPDRAVVFKLL